MTAPSLVGMPGQEVCGDIVLEGATQSTTAQLTPLSYYWGPGAFSGQNGQCAGSSATGVAQVGALETCNVRICTLIAGATLDFNFSFQEDEQTTAQEFASVSFQEPPAPVITASSDVASGTFPLFVYFSALGVTGNITSWLFDFGDGISGTYYTGSNSYFYYTPGDFTVTVRGIDSYGRESNEVSIPISVLPVYGCIDYSAYNYNPMASSDDGSCQYYVYGCMDGNACNYNSSANYDDGTCDYSCFYTYGCTDYNACNYDSSAYYDNGTCDYSCHYVSGCTNSSAMNYNPSANMDDGSCQIPGCTNSSAMNYNYYANYDDGSCQVYGCTDSMASNYYYSANYDDGSCQYANGVACSTNTMCASGNCIGGSCNAGGSNGTACSQNYECGSNACNYGYCDGGNLAGCTTYAYKDGHFYCFIANDTSFSQARYSAPPIQEYSEGGHLVVINDEQEYNLVVNLISGYNRSIWLGMTDLAQEGSWQPVTGQPLNWTYWGPGEPNNHTGTGDPSGEHFASLGTWWGGGTYMINDQPASQWSLNAVVYEYEVGIVDQTPNPNCSTDYDGDGVCDEFDADDYNSRVNVGPELVSMQINSEYTQVDLSGTRLGNMSYIRIMPQWVQDYINWGWWPSYYADWYSSLVYYWSCSYTDTSVSCPFYLPYNWANGYSNGTIVVSLVDQSGAQSNSLSTYIDVTPSISYAEANPAEGWIKLEGNNLNSGADPFYSLQIGDWYQNNYYIYYNECSTLTNTQIICPYSSSRNSYNNTYGYFYTSNGYYSSQYFIFNIYGCTDPSAGNYVPGANINNGSCDYTPVLVSHWKFDGDYNDYGTSGNHASYISSGISLTSGGVAQFSASANYGGSYIDLGSPYTTLTSSATTVSFWYKADTVANNPLFMDFKMGGGDTFITLSPGSSSGTHRVFWAPRGWGYTVGSQEYSVSGWTQVTIVYNGNGMWNWGGSEVSFYINGTLVSNTSWDCCNGGYIPYTNQIGRDSFSGQWGDNSRAYSGLLDDVRVYRGNLSQWDISNLYNERASLYFSGVSNGACYQFGTIVSYLTNGSGYCSGNEKYYINDEQTTLDATGSGVHDGLRYVAGTLAHGFVSGAPDDDNTILLLHMDGASFVDSSASNRSVTPIGNAVVSTAQSKFGGESGYFDGSADSIDVSNLPNDYLASDFTIEAWVWLYPGQSNQALFNTQPHNSLGISLNRDNTGYTHVYVGNGSWWETSMVSSSPLSFNEWHHIALVRSGSNLTLYHNGQSQASTTGYVPSGFSGSARISGITLYDWEVLYGYIDEFRITRNLARYTSNFTPATEAFGSSGCYSNGVDTGTVVNGTGPCEGVYYIAGSSTTLPIDGSGEHDGKTYFAGILANGYINGICYAEGVNTGGVQDGFGYCSVDTTFYIDHVAKIGLDQFGNGFAGGLRFDAGALANGFVGGAPDDNNTILLMHMDGANGSTSFVDSSASAFSPEIVGSPIISTAQSRFGGASAYFHGTGDYGTAERLQFGPSETLALGTGDFTIEAWFYQTGTAQAIPMPIEIGGPHSNSDAFGMWFHPNDWGNVGITGWYSQPLNNSGPATSLNEWTHVAWVRRDGSVTIFVNGVAGTSAALPHALGGSGLRIGGGAYQNYYNYEGYIDELRITKGFARYTSNFTPATVAFGSSACYSNGVDTGTVIDGTGTCEGVTYVKGSRRCFDMNGQDADEDGYCDFEDCNDSSALVPAAREIPGDSLDNNCNGETDEVVWSWGHQGNQLGCSAQGASGTENFLGEAFGTSQHGGDCSAYCQNQFPGQVMCVQMYATWAYGGGHCACYSSSTTYSWSGWYDRDVWLLTITSP